MYTHGFAYARSQSFYVTTTVWQWKRMPGDIVFALGALLMGWDFLVKLLPLLPRFATGGKRDDSTHTQSRTVESPS